MTSQVPLVVTRADPGGAATAARARAMGLDVRHLPLFTARALSWRVPDPAAYDAMLLTSAQAVRLAGPGLARLADLPVHAVGEATADAARAAGLTVTATGARGAQACLDAMAPQGIARILWLCGRDRSHLDPHQMRLEPLPCYAVDAVPPPPGWDVALANGAVLLAHSVRGGRRLADLVDAPRGRLAIVAISAAVARAAGDGWGAVAVADRPDDAAMLAEAHALCHKGRQMGSFER